MNFNTRPVLRLAAVGAVALLAACASKPKPGPAAGPVAPAGPPPAETFPAPPGEVSMSGTAAPGTVQDFIINVGDRIYFDFDSYDIRSDATPVLDSQAQWLARYPAVRVRIEGNADERGTREYNLALGARRANAVQSYLVSRGVSPSRISTVSYGKERPIDPGSDEGAWAKNRNAHTTITDGAR
ncbi:MAG: peptidoglycan-associated lipoprotein Pal [Caulobacteraceae bacterium]